MSKPVRILCIDDDIDVLDTLKGIIELEGHQVFTAASVQHALRFIAQEGTFTHCFCDFEMSGIQGDVFLAHLAVKHPGIVRILMSAYGRNYPRIAQAIRTGVCANFIEKPLLVGNIRNALVVTNQ
jgi:two-component system NtrC family sensor kinase